MERNIKVYWMVITVILLVGIFVFIQLSNNQEAIQYLGFAGTITSLILGLIAIFYSIIVNTESSKNIGRLDETIKRVSDAAATMDKVSPKIDSSIHNLTAISEEVRNKIEGLPSEIKQMHSDLLKELNQQTPKISSASSTSSPQDFNTNNLLSFLKETSFNGQLLIYACKLCKEKSEGFNFKKLAEKSYNILALQPPFIHGQTQYSYGFLIAISSLGLVRGNIRPEEIIKITEMNSFVEDKIEDILKEDVAAYDKSNPNVEGTLSRTQQIEILESLF